MAVDRLFYRTYFKELSTAICQMVQTSAHPHICTFAHCSLYLCRMEQLLQQIEAYRQEIASTQPNGPDSLEAYRIKFLGTKGIMKNLFAEMKNVPNEKKKEFG